MRILSQSKSVGKGASTNKKFLHDEHSSQQSMSQPVPALKRPLPIINRFRVLKKNATMPGRSLDNSFKLQSESCPIVLVDNDNRKSLATTAERISAALHEMKGVRSQ